MAETDHFSGPPYTVGRMSVVVHRRKPKPTPTAYHSSSEERLRDLLRPLADEDVVALTPASATRIRAALQQQYASAVEHGYVD